MVAARLYQHMLNCCAPNRMKSSQLTLSLSYYLTIARANLGSRE